MANEVSDSQLFNIAKQVAWRKASSNVDVEELTQDIAERLIIARKQYNKDKNMSMTNYLYQHANYAVKDSYRKGFAAPGSYVLNRSGSRYYFIEYNTVEDFGDEVDRTMEENLGLIAVAKLATKDKYFVNQKIKETLLMLSNRERKILYQSHCLEYSREEIAKMEGCSVSKIDQVKARAIRKCQNHLANAA